MPKKELDLSELADLIAEGPSGQEKIKKQKQAIDAHVGGWIVEAALGKRESLTRRFRAEFIAFYEPEAEDADQV